MKATFTRSAAAMLVVCACSTAWGADEDFVKKAAMGGVAEVEAGTLAQQKGGSDSVKQFGARMVQDHTKANDELKQIATAKGITVPGTADPAHQKAKSALEAKGNKKFDAAFKAQMVSDHKATIALFQKEATSGTDPELKAFAGKTLPDLKDHLKMAQAMK